MTPETAFPVAPISTKPFADADAFAAEQRKLAGIWTFLGMTHDVAKDGDWLRATLATREVFVQRFGTELKGFENSCAHRFYPLRNAAKGNGPIVCGFHHWRYDKDGLALGIPNCMETYGKTPRELNARLTPVEIATCGAFIFGRFDAPGRRQSLDEFLGHAAPVLQALSAFPRAPYKVEVPVQANWRLCYHITLDDYHGVAVHSSTFGAKGYLNPKAMGYFRIGPHSAFLSTAHPNALNRLVNQLRKGTYESAHYFIFQIFPNLIVSHGRADGQNWQILVQQYVPVAADRSLLRTWHYPSPLAANHPKHHRFTRYLTEPFRTLAVRYIVRRIRNEDHAVCRRIQEVAAHLGRVPRLGALEERIEWFEEAYAQAVADGNDTARV